MIQGRASGGKSCMNMEIHEIDLTEEPDDAIRQVKAAVRRSTRAIIITPFENDELQKQLKKAREKGISLIYLMRFNPMKYPVPIVTDDEAAVKKQDICWRSQWEEGKAVILSTWRMIKSPRPGKGISEALGEYDDIKLVNLFYCNVKKRIPKDPSGYFNAHPDIKGIFAACLKLRLCCRKGSSRQSQGILWAFITQMKP